MALLHPPDICLGVLTCANSFDFQLTANNALKHAVFGSTICTFEDRVSYSVQWLEAQFAQYDGLTTRHIQHDVLAA